MNCSRVFEQSTTEFERKCLLGAKEIKFLIHLLSRGGVRPDSEKVGSIANFPRLKNIHVVKSFIRLCSYCRRVIQNFSEETRPLQKLLQEQVKSFWITKPQMSFETLQRAFTSDPVFGLFDHNAPTELHTNASGYGLEAVLVQVFDNKGKVIAYSSRTFDKGEMNHSTTERESLAVI